MTDGKCLVPWHANNFIRTFSDIPGEDSLSIGKALPMVNVGPERAQ